VLVAAAVVPSPPALVPEVASGAASELDDVRSASFDAVRRLLVAAPDRVVVVAQAESTGWRDARERADLTAFGVDLVLPGGGPGPGARPLGHVLGLWLLGRVGCTVPVAYLGVAPDLGTTACLALGMQLADGPERVAVLCVGDGSARRADTSPRWPDPRAVSYDESVGAALAAVDLAALRALDVATALDLVAAGRAPWQVLAGAAVSGGVWSGELLLAAAPYGVGYLVAAWARRDLVTAAPEAALR
jgi:hypothetical protein